jgi:hypothetical protein
MARVRSTARVAREGEEASTSETAPISEDVLGWLYKKRRNQLQQKMLLMPKLNRPSPKLIVKTKIMMMAF